MEYKFLGDKKRVGQTNKKERRKGVCRKRKGRGRQKESFSVSLSLFASLLFTAPLSLSHALALSRWGDVVFLRGRCLSVVGECVWLGCSRPRGFFFALMARRRPCFPFYFFFLGLFSLVLSLALFFFFFVFFLFFFHTLLVNLEVPFLLSSSKSTFSCALLASRIKCAQW